MSEQQQVEPAEQPVSGERTVGKRDPTIGQLKTMMPSQAHASMLREIRSWGWWLVLIGAIHLFTSGFLNSAWGILLILVGLASFYFKDAAMFVIYSVTLASAAIWNLVSFTSGWMVFAVVQIILTVQVFRRFRIYRNVQSSTVEDENSSAEPSRSMKLFPVTALILGLVGLAGVAGLNLTAIIAGVVGLDFPQFVVFAINLSLNIGILGFAVGLGAVLSDFPNRGLAIVGSIAGGLAMGIELGLILLSNILF